MNNKTIITQDLLYNTDTNSLEYLGYDGTMTSININSTTPVSNQLEKFQNGLFNQTGLFNKVLFGHPNEKYHTFEYEGKYYCVCDEEVISVVITGETFVAGDTKRTENYKPLSNYKNHEGKYVHVLSKDVVIEKQEEIYVPTGIWGQIHRPKKVVYNTLNKEVIREYVSDVFNNKSK